MLLTYFNVALRVIKRNLSFTIINVSGIAIGLATYTLIMLWVNDELNYDKFNTNFKNLYRVVENQHYAGGEIFPVAVTPSGLAAKMKEEYPEVIKSSRLSSQWYTVKQGDKVFQEEFSLTDPDYLEMFSIEIIEGDRKSALISPNSVILTEELATRYFGEESPLGKSLNIDKKEFTVRAVMKNFPKNAHFQVKSIIPFTYLKESGRIMDEWDSNAYWTYVLLSPQTDISSFNKKIKNLINKHHSVGPRTDIYVQPIGEIHLYNSGKFTAELGTQGDIRYVRALRMIAIIILLIACINFMNLSTAQSVKRAKEVGIRKVSGSGRENLILQFLGESLLLVIIADVIAMVLVELLLPVFNTLTAKDLSIDYFSISHLTSSLGIVLITGIVAGSYPAFFLSSFSPLKVLKGKFNTGNSAAVFRKILVTGQFAISIVLIIGTLVITKQLKYIHEMKLGYDYEDLVYIYYRDDLKTHMPSFKQDLLANPDIVAVANSNHVPTYIGNSSSEWSWEGKNPTDNVLLHMVLVDEDYQKTFKIEMSEGRYYSPEMANDSACIVINETAAKLIDGKKSVLGKTLRSGKYNLKIIGVVKDFHFKSVHRKIEPLILAYMPKECNIAFIRIGSRNKAKTLAYIEKVYKKYTSDQPYNLQFLDESLHNMYLAEKRMGTLFRYFSALAIFISCLGLLGLSLFTAEQKTKEIGVRKTLGASVPSVILMFLKQYFRWVAVATLIATPIAWYAMQAWLNNFAYRITLSPIDFILASLLAFGIAMLTVGYHAFKAANQNPIQSLRYE